MRLTPPAPPAVAGALGIGPRPGVALARRRGTFRLVTGPVDTNADALAALADAWRQWLHAAGVRPGDRVVCALPPGPGFIALLDAALDAGVTFAPVPPAADVDVALDDADARLAVVAAAPAPGRAPRLRSALGAPTPDVALLLLTSGSTGASRRIALSAANVEAVLASHAPHLGLDPGATALSVLPWHHVFGLVLELLPALRGGATLGRDPTGGRDPAALVATAGALARSLGVGRRVTHLHAVPQTVRLLAEREDGRALLASLRAGLVGGAPVDAALATVLETTRLRVGYGQTEAAPGIALGEPGAWRAGTLGRPLGCEVRLDDDGVLAFRGPNACLGEFRDHALHRAPANRWVRTGDLARPESDGTYTFEGRAADSFKLENGRHVAALAVERAVCARWPHVTDALLSTSDGRALVLAASTHAPGDPLPNVADLAPLLGPLAVRPLRVVRVEPGAWARSPKGELDRRFPTGRVG